MKWLAQIPSGNLCHSRGSNSSSQDSLRLLQRLANGPDIAQHRLHVRPGISENRSVNWVVYPPQPEPILPSFPECLSLFSFEKGLGI